MTKNYVKANDLKTAINLATKTDRERRVELEKCKQLRSEAKVLETKLINLKSMANSIKKTNRNFKK